MDPELKRLLEENLELSRENNAMLRKLRNTQKWAKIWNIVKYIIWAGIAFGAYKFLEPYLKNISEALQSVSGFTKFF